MATAKLTSKGQITIPKVVRERLGPRVGDEVEFIEEDEVFQIRRQVLESPFRKWRGYLKHLKGQSSDELVEEMRGR